jgi:hypothetical protein
MEPLFGVCWVRHEIPRVVDRLTAAPTISYHTPAR